MARPKKNNADYFPHDSGLRNDRKIKALRSKFGHVGYSIYVMLIESLTDADFFELEFDEIGIELLAGDFDVESEKLCQVVEYCKLLNLIQGSCEENKIWSDRHKRNFDGLLNKRKRDRSRVIADENSVTDNENPQSKVKKKESKENNITTICNIPLKDGSNYKVTENEILEWSKTFPNINVTQQLLVCAKWNETNKAKRKTPRGIKKHILSWLSRSRSDNKQPEKDDHNGFDKKDYTTGTTKQEDLPEYLR